MLRDSQDYLEENPRILWDCCGNSEIFSEAIPGIFLSGNSWIFYERIKEFSLELLGNSWDSLFGFFVTESRNSVSQNPGILYGITEEIPGILYEVIPGFVFCEGIKEFSMELLRESQNSL